MYDYQEYNPDRQLTPWVKNYWIADGFIDGEILPKVFPDGCTDIIYIYDKTKGTSYTGIFGTMTRFIEVEFSASTLMFGIRFKPAGITAFTRVHIDEFTDWSVDLTLVETLFDKSFYEALPEKQSIREIITHTDNYLLSRLPFLHNSEKQIIRAIDLIYNPAIDFDNVFSSTWIMKFVQIKKVTAIAGSPYGTPAHVT